MSIFLHSYLSSDFFGKLIFLMLFVVSIGSWTILVRKFLLLRSITAKGKDTVNIINDEELTELLFQQDHSFERHPFANVLSAISEKAGQLINKNKHFKDGAAIFLSRRDVDAIEEYSSMTIYKEIKTLGNDLFILSTVVSLAPFLGILGNVWGILISLGELQKGGGSSNTIILGGLSTALATTVLGLVIAIPALIAYNYLKNSLSSINADMENLSHKIVSELELQYRSVEV